MCVSVREGEEVREVCVGESRERDQPVQTVG